MNIYDGEDFFAAYGKMPRSRESLSAAGEWSRLCPLVPDLRLKKA